VRQREELGGIVGVQANAGMRGRPAQALKVEGGMNGVTAVGDRNWLNGYPAGEICSTVHQIDQPLDDCRATTLPTTRWSETSLANSRRRGFLPVGGSPPID